MELPASKPSKAKRDERYYQLRNENRIRVYEHLKRKGFSNEAIAGIMANIEIETGGSFNPFQRQTATGDPRRAKMRGTGYGLFQLDQAGKRKDYEEWLRENKKDADAMSYNEALETQLDYMTDSIFKKGKYRDRVGAGNADDVKKYIQTSRDPAQIALEFSNKWERAGKAHNARRMKEAESILNEIRQGDLDRGFIKKFTGQYNEGGMALEKQMELFEDGGLKDEGGTIDPVSGNDVPPGSTQEEVRDDIPAQLSEGEFVFPADVVRYIGLEKLMQMRQEAKMGLKAMEDMGQMGNSDEAVIPDDLPFDLSDLDMEDELDYNMNEGGVVGMPATYTPPKPVAVPIATTPETLPDFEQYMTSPETESIEYINPETGERRTFTFINGEPTVAIPEGFIPVSEYKEPEVITPEPVVGTTQVRDDPGREDLDAARYQAEVDKYGAGGATAKLGIKDFFGVGQDYVYGVNYLDGMGFGLAGIGQAVSGNIPDDATILLKNDNDEVLLTGAEYKTMAKEVKAKGTSYTATRDIIDAGRVRAGDAARQRFMDSLTSDDDDKNKGTSYSLTNKQLDDYAKSYSGITDFSFDGGEMSMPTPPPVTKRSPDGIGTGDTGGRATVTKNPAGSFTGAEKYAYNESDRNNSISAGQSFGSTSDFGGFDDVNRDDPEAEGDFNAGGLASKPKPKAKKKMKRGGLASKK